MNGNRLGRRKGCRGETGTGPIQGRACDAHCKGGGGAGVRVAWKRLKDAERRMGTTLTRSLKDEAGGYLDTGFTPCRTS
ncbi:hypothetical protein HPP92_022906 [Vanilla planifolia]|uniref:Uncharacterized protein n=1 Tax=Vanilla planifolia TaxID=51239 RepID=A0A835PVL4_VANPL|nr:hypothetical protein HPP92_023333 [Vanilla planifolia]KAG0459778.1 hypothetical protein HPP92_022906 [Vanilla planifolia]